MSNTPNLNIPLMPSNPSSPDVIYSNGVQQIEEALTGILSLDCSAGGTITMTQNQTQQNWQYSLTGTPAANFILKVASYQRPFQVVNNSGKQATVEVGSATTTVVVPNGGSAWLMSDGSANITSIDGRRRKLVALAQAANFTLTVPNGYAIARIYIEETSGHAITGGLKIGTTSGATDVVVAQAVAASSLNFVTDATLLKRIFSTTADQQLFLQAVTAWNSAVINIQMILDLIV